jgi:hypothetical protein
VKSHAAFISYSHAVDGALAPAIKAALQRLAKPWYRRRSMRVFHDKASLSVNPGLWSTLQTILSDTEFFVLLASPESAASEWVNREVEYWLRSAAPNRLGIEPSGARDVSGSWPGNGGVFAGRSLPGDCRDGAAARRRQNNRDDGLDQPGRIEDLGQAVGTAPLQQAARSSHQRDRLCARRAEPRRSGASLNTR